MDRIESSQNTRFKELQKLCTSASFRRDAQLIILDGVHLIKEWLAASQGELISIFIDESGKSSEIEDLLRALGKQVSITVLSNSLFEKIKVTKTSQGIIAVAARPTLQRESHKAKFALALEEVQDPGNLGAIFRAGAAFGVDCIYLSSGCADPYSPKTLRGGMGAQFKLDVIENVDLVSLAQEFSGRVIGTGAKGGTPMEALDLSGEVLLIFGSEGAGLSQRIQTVADQIVSIPLANKVESLNVACAVTLICYKKHDLSSA